MTHNVENQQDSLMVPGQFALPTPESNLALTSSLGAERATWDDQDDRESIQNPNEFPMIVWLRGDEPWFTEFNLDADAVMSALNIKRSRLTQISGRELRVGRVRVDRYIRPVYRSTDVDQYLAWTRATASHQKSSDVIKTAVDQLHEQSTYIQKTLEFMSSSFTDLVKSQMTSFVSETIIQEVNPLSQKVTDLGANVTQVASELTKNIEHTFNQSMQQLNATSIAIMENSKQQAAALEAMTLQLNKSSEKIAAMEERLNAWDNMLVQNLKDISEELASLKKPKKFQKIGPQRIPSYEKTSILESVKKPKLNVRSSPSRRKPK